MPLGREPAPHSVAYAYYASDDEVLLDDDFDTFQGLSYAEWNDRLRGEELFEEIDAELTHELRQR